MREIVYRPVKAMCDDGTIRTVRARSTVYSRGLYPDTAFSVPAYVQVRGTTIRGYICPLDGMARTQDHGATIAFRAVTYCRNHGTMPRKV